MVEIKSLIKLSTLLKRIKWHFNVTVYMGSCSAVKMIKNNLSWYSKSVVTARAVKQ